MKKIIALLLVLSFAAVLASCGGDKQNTPDTTVDASTTAAGTEADVTTVDNAATVDVLFGKWTALDKSSTVEIKAGTITETDGSVSGSYSYTVSSIEKNASGDTVAVLKYNDIERTFTVFAKKTGYSDNCYLEIATSKTTLKYSK